MVLLDDHEAPYKLRGIQIVSEMLKKVPADVLRRTGVGVLLFSVRNRLSPRFVECPLIIMSAFAR